jgi:predicted PhzF superfamily epimerase YddE/YHI9
MDPPYFQVLAFTTSYVGGNPASLCPLNDDWLEGERRQRIAWQHFQ